MQVKMKTLLDNVPGIHARAAAISRRNGKALFICGLATAVVLLLAVSLASGELPRQIGASFHTSYYVLDSNFYGLENAFGASAAFRYEVIYNVFLENTIGGFTTDDGNVTVNGFNYQLGGLAVFPVLIPYRPLARLGIGFISVNPITVTPTATFRPTQTAFYFYGGSGITRSIRENISLEASATFWVTPYQYRIYTFNRSDVDTDDEQFTHLSISLGISYLF